MAAAVSSTFRYNHSLAGFNQKLMRLVVTITAPSQTDINLAKGYFDHIENGTWTLDQYKKRVERCAGALRMGTFGVAYTITPIQRRNVREG